MVLGRKRSGYMERHNGKTDSARRCVLARPHLTKPASHTVPRKLGYRFLTVFEKNKVEADGTLWDLEIHVRFDDTNLPGWFNQDG